MQNQEGQTCSLLGDWGQHTVVVVTPVLAIHVPPPHICCGLPCGVDYRGRHMRREHVGAEEQAVCLVVDAQQVWPPGCGDWYQL